MYSLVYDSQHGLCLRQYVMIPETDDAIALLLQVSTAGCVVCLLFLVLCAVHFDDDFVFAIEKIDDVTANDSLPVEADAMEAAVA